MPDLSRRALLGAAAVVPSCTLPAPDEERRFRLFAEYDEQAFNVILAVVRDAHGFSLHPEGDIRLQVILAENICAGDELEPEPGVPTLWRARRA